MGFSYYFVSHKCKLKFKTITKFVFTFLNNQIEFRLLLCYHVKIITHNPFKIIVIYQNIRSTPHSPLSSFNTILLLRCICKKYFFILSLKTICRIYPSFAALLPKSSLKIFLFRDISSASNEKALCLTHSEPVKPGSNSCTLQQMP